MDLEELSCKVCMETYGDTFVPRILGCGHALCTSCLDRILSESKECPECRFKLESFVGSDFPVVYPLLRLATTYLANLNLQSQPQRKKTSPKSSKQLTDVGECGAHGNKMFFMCITCDTWVCRDCLVVDHPQHVQQQSKCRILNIKEALEEMKQTSTEKLNQGIESLKSIKEEIRSVQRDLMKTKQEYQKEIDSLEAKLEAKKNSRLQVIIRNQDAENKLDDLDDLVASVEKAKRNVHEAELPLDVSSSFMKAKSYQESIGRIIEEDKKFIKHALPNIMRFNFGDTPGLQPRFGDDPFRYLQVPSFNDGVCKSTTVKDFPPTGSDIRTQFGVTTGLWKDTPFKYCATTGTDNMTLNGVSTNIRTKFQVITEMKEYKDKSFEELRLEDYLAHRKGPETKKIIWPIKKNQDAPKISNSVVNK